MLMSLSGSSDSRCSSWATTRLAMSWLTWVPRKMIRSLSRREEMSKERSPREVCSTTIGTRGLMVGTLSKAPGGYPPSSRLRRPERALLLLLLLRGPDLLARLGLLERDRHRRPDDQVDRLAHANVFADHRVAAILAQPLQQLLRRRPLVLGGGGPRPGHFLPRGLHPPPPAPVARGGERLRVPRRSRRSLPRQRRRPRRAGSPPRPVARPPRRAARRCRRAAPRGSRTRRPLRRNRRRARAAPSPAPPSPRP